MSEIQAIELINLVKQLVAIVGVLAGFIIIRTIVTGR